MFASMPMQDMATVESESRVPLCAPPTKPAAPDLRQILSPRLSNSQNMEICSPTLGFASPTLDRGREVSAAQEDARKQKKVANNARRELQRTQKELHDLRVQVMYLEQKCRGYEAESGALKEQLANAVTKIDLEAVEMERDMYQEQEQEALRELDESRQKEQDALRQLNDERKARIKAEQDCAKAKQDLRNAEQERTATSARRNDFKKEWNAIRVERDSFIERYRASQRDLDRQEEEAALLRAQLKQQQNRSSDLEAQLRRSVEIQQQTSAAFTHVQQEHNQAIQRHEKDNLFFADRLKAARDTLNVNRQAHDAWIKHCEDLNNKLQAAEQHNFVLQSQLGHQSAMFWFNAGQSPAWGSGPNGFPHQA